MSQYFSKPCEPFGGDINVKVDFSNYATKTDVKNVTHVDVSSIALKSNLASLKAEVDKLDIDRLTPVPNDLAKPSNVVKSDVVKKAVYGKLVTKVNSIDTTEFVLKTKYDTDKSDLEKKISDAGKRIPDTSDKAKERDLKAKITEIEGKIPSITGLATNSALTAVENKIPDVSSLVNKSDYNSKICETENKVSDHNYDKCITTPEFNILAARVFNARLAQAYLVTKTDFDAKLKKNCDRVTSHKTKHPLVETELKNKKNSMQPILKPKIIIGDGTQNYLVFQPVYKYFEMVGNKVSSWDSKGFSSKKITSASTSYSNRVPKLVYNNARIKLKFDEVLLKQDKVIYNHGPIVNIYIVYKLTTNTADFDVTIQNGLCSAVKLTKNVNISKYKYSAYGIEFSSRIICCIFIASTCISSVFIYFHWHFKKDNFHVKFNSGTQTTIY